MADPFFIDEELDWWGDAETAPAVAVPRRRRPPPRTLAGDLRRLRAGFERRSPVPPAAAALLGLALLAALAVVLRLSLGGEEATPVAPVAARPAQVTPTPAAPAAPTALLEEGAHGAAVEDLQVALTALGFHSGADGGYGATTTAAVAAFQGSNGLLADGVAGPATATALQGEFAERAAEDAESAEAGIAAALAAGKLDPAAAETARTAVAATVEAIAEQAPGRSAVLALALHDVAAVADGYTAKRAALFQELQANVEALRTKAPEIEPTVRRRRRRRRLPLLPRPRLPVPPARQLRQAQQPRPARPGRRGRTAGRGARRAGRQKRERAPLAVPLPLRRPRRVDVGLRAGDGRPVARGAGKLLGDSRLLDAAAAAFRAIPRDLTLPVGDGSWIQEYSFSDMAVLNAHLQSIVSLGDYVELSGNEDAGAFVAGLVATATALLPSFDTGCWSLYSLDGKPATDSYHAYHVRLLERLGRRTGEAAFRDTGARWRGYQSAGGC